MVAQKQETEEAPKQKEYKKFQSQSFSGTVTIPVLVDSKVTRTKSHGIAVNRKFNKIKCLAGHRNEKREKSPTYARAKPGDQSLKIV